MLEVSTSHFNHAQVNGGPGPYMHANEPSSIYSQKRKDTYNCSTNFQYDVFGVEQSNHLKTLSNEIDDGSPCGDTVRRRVCELRSQPLSVSTPTSECALFGECFPSDYLQKKAKRISRIYQDNSSDPFEALEVEPLLLEYLVRHGALTVEASALILGVEKQDQKVLLLSELGLSSENALRRFEPDNIPSASLATGFALLLNALRHTGHHTLASRLDCGRRIRPSPFYQSSELLTHGTLPSTQRRRGQLSLQIRLDAIKVDPATYDQLLQSRAPDGADDTKSKINGRSTDFGATTTQRKSAFTPMLPSFVECLAEDRSPVLGSPQSAKQAIRLSTPQAPFWIDLNEPVTAETEESLPQPTIDDRFLSVPPPPEKSPGCFNKFFCLFRPFRKRKSRKRKAKSVVEPPQTPVPINPRDENDVGLTRSRLPILPTDGAGDGPRIDQLSAAKLALLDTKSSEFCQALLNSSLPFYDTIVKYFEQSSGVLVLDCAIDSGSQPSAGKVTDTGSGSALRLTLVATRTDLVRRLTDACQSSSEPLSAQVEPHSARTIKPDPLCGCRVSTDLQKILTESGIRSELQVQDFRLSVLLDPTEVTKALEELADMVE